MFDYNVRVIPFPNIAVPALVTPNDDGSFDIYINGRLPEPQQRKALQHELEHIKRDHFYREDPVACMEAEANREPAPIISPAPTKNIRLYKSLKHMENYLAGIGALTIPIEYLAERRV